MAGKSLVSEARQTQLAIDLILRHLEQGIQPHSYADGKVDFILYTSENVE